MNWITTNHWIHCLHTRKFFIKISIKIKQMMLRWLMLRPKGGSYYYYYYYLGGGGQMEKIIAKKDTIDFTRQK